MTYGLDELFSKSILNRGVQDLNAFCHCGSREGVKMESSRTMYEVPVPTRFDRVLEEIPLDPNRDIPLCRDCAEEHHRHWSEMWDMYYSSCM